MCQRERVRLGPIASKTSKYEAICSDFSFGLGEMKVDYKVSDPFKSKQVQNKKERPGRLWSWF